MKQYLRCSFLVIIIFALMVSGCKKSGPTEPSVSGTGEAPIPGAGFLYTINADDTLTIVGIRNDAAETVVIPPAIDERAVTGIGGSAFVSNTAIRSLSAMSVVFIEDGKYSNLGTYHGAFSGCVNLTNVAIPNLADIGAYAFVDCAELTTVAFPFVTNIGRSAFRSSGLTNAAFTNITNIGDYAFERCTALKRASFPTATTIGEGAFQYCAALPSQSIFMPNVTTIGSNAFLYCISLLDSAPFSAVSTVYAYAFRYSGMTNAIFTNITVMHPYAFGGCTSLRYASLPLITQTSGHAFADCTALESVLPFSNVTTVDSYAFSSSGVTNTAFPNLVRVNGTNAFASCSALVDVTIPTATYIGYGAFRSSGVTNISLTNAVVFNESVFAYCWALEEVYIPKLMGMPWNTFWGASALKNVVLPSVAYLQGGNFESCGALTNVELGAVASIGFNAFKNASSLRTVTINAATPPALYVGGDDVLVHSTHPKDLYVPIGSDYSSWEGYGFTVHYTL